MTVDDRVIAAVDQGGTKTLAMVRAGGSEYTGTAGGACWFYTGYQKALDCLFSALSEACGQAGVRFSDISALGGGIAGLNYPNEAAKYSRLTLSGLRSRGARPKLYLQNDCEAALYSEGDPDCDLAVMALGTEFNAAIRPHGEKPFVYGNYTTEEDLGGKALGRFAVEAAALASIYAEERTSLERKLPLLFGYDSVDDLRLAYRKNELPLPVSTAAKTVFAEAKAGDAVSRKLILRLAENTSRYLRGGIRRCGLRGKRVRVLLTGGLMKNDYQPFEDELRRRITEICPLAEVKTAERDPVWGALYAAENSIRSYLM